jgi:hypothetical protein
MEIKFLIQAFYQLLGNKRYIHDLEILLNEKLTDLTPHEQQTLMYLFHDLKSIRR